MNRMRVAVSAAALALAAAILLRPSDPGASAPPARPQAPPAARRALPAPTVPAEVPARDIFQYAGDGGAPEEQRGDGGGEAVTLPAPPPLDPAAAGALPPAPEGPHLVGFVRRGGALRAALSLDGEVVVLGAGERAGSYRVLSVDEDEGVRLVDDAGATVTLAPPQ